MEGDRGDGLDVSDGQNVGLGSTPLDLGDEEGSNDDRAAAALDSLGYGVDDQAAVERPNDDGGFGGWLRTIKYIAPLVVVVLGLFLLVAVWFV